MLRRACCPEHGLVVDFKVEGGEFWEVVQGRVGARCSDLLAHRWPVYVVAAALPDVSQQSLTVRTVIPNSAAADRSGALSSTSARYTSAESRRAAARASRDRRLSRAPLRTSSAMGHAIVRSESSWIVSGSSMTVPSTAAPTGSSTPPSCFEIDPTTVSSARARQRRWYQRPVVAMAALAGRSAAGSSPSRRRSRRWSSTRTTLT